MYLEKYAKQFPLTTMQIEIIKAIELLGGITSDISEKYGWTTRGGLPTAQFQQLIREYRIVAPRVLTSIPLRVIWQFRETHKNVNNNILIEKTINRAKIKEYAKGGFKL